LKLHLTLSGTVAMRFFNPKTGQFTAISDSAPRKVEAHLPAEAPRQEAPGDDATGPADPSTPQSPQDEIQTEGDLD
jgi:hypothetical protein